MGDHHVFRGDYPKLSIKMIGHLIDNHDSWAYKYNTILCNCCGFLGGVLKVKKRKWPWMIYDTSCIQVCILLAKKKQTNKQKRLYIYWNICLYFTSMELTRIMSVCLKTEFCRPTFVLNQFGLFCFILIYLFYCQEDITKTTSLER